MNKHWDFFDTKSTFESAKENQPEILTYLTNTIEKASRSLKFAGILTMAAILILLCEILITVPPAYSPIGSLIGLLAFLSIPTLLFMPVFIWKTCFNAGTSATILELHRKHGWVFDHFEPSKEFYALFKQTFEEFLKNSARLDTIENQLWGEITQGGATQLFWSVTALFTIRRQFSNYAGFSRSSLIVAFPIKQHTNQNTSLNCEEFNREFMASKNNEIKTINPTTLKQLLVIKSKYGSFGVWIQKDSVTFSFYDSPLRFKNPMLYLKSSTIERNVTHMEEFYSELAMAAQTLH